MTDTTRPKYVSNCCGCKMYESRCYSSKLKQWLDPFMVCECCDTPCTPIKSGEVENKEKKDE